MQLWRAVCVLCTTQAATATAHPPVPRHCTRTADSAEATLHVYVFAGFALAILVHYPTRFTNPYV